MKAYVLGFIRDGSRILLIEKKRPDWQAGKINGIGGKIEAGESPLVAMRRECKEESGLIISNWVKVVTMQDRDWIMHCFRTYGPVLEAQTMTDEALFIARSDCLPANVLPKLHWLIPLCFDQQITKSVLINYNEP